MKGRACCEICDSVDRVQTVNGRPLCAWCRRLEASR